MDHFETDGALADLAETRQSNTGLELRLLLAGKVKEAQRELAAAVTDPHEQVAAAAVYGLGKQYLAADEATCTGFESADSDELRSILVAQRQQKQKVLDALQAEAAELCCECGPDATQVGHGRRESLVRGFHRGPGRPQSARIASASTSAPLGNEATPTAARAGNGRSK